MAPVLGQARNFHNNHVAGLNKCVYMEKGTYKGMSRKMLKRMAALALSGKEK